MIVEWIEIKSPDWKVVSLKDAQGKVTADVSVNRTSKKGEVFPNFDAITLGATVDGELWQSTAGKWYLFAPKNNLGSKPAWAKKENTINKAMDRKEDSIEKFQSSKENSIKMAGAMRDATLLTVEQIKQAVARGEMVEVEDMKVMWSDWRTWLLGKSEEPF